MELEINQVFAKHYNEYRSKEEAARTKKQLKREIKEIEESSSSSSDSEEDLDYQKKYVDQCDKLLRDIETKGVDVIKELPIWLNDFSSDKTTAKVEKPIFAKDLNRKILLDGGIENEAELQEIENISKIDSDDIINKCQKPMDIINDLENVSDDENFFKPSSKPQKFVIKNIEKDVKIESNITYSDDEEIDESIQPSEPGKIEINHDRRIKSLRVSKTITRPEKRQMKKERKELELKEKMKKLQEIRTKSLLEKIDRIKKVVPQAAEHLILDKLDEDFDIEEISKKLTEFFEKEDSSLPVDKEKPIFSDDSDFENEVNEYLGEDDDEEEEGEEKPAIRKSSKKVEKTQDKSKKENKSSFFTNLEILESKIKKKTGIVKKNKDEIFDPEKHVNFSKYLKRNFDICCEDLILGRDDQDDILCKFKFRQVEKQDYGLDTEEIILADNKELNKWASLKKITRIRSNIEEEKDRIRYERMKGKKHEILKSVYCSDPTENDSENEKPKEEVEDKEEETEENVLSRASKKRLRKMQKKRKLKEMIVENDLTNEEEEPMLKKSKKIGGEVENIQESSVKKSKKNQDGECQMNNEEEEPMLKKSKKIGGEVENTQELPVKKSKKIGGEVENTEESSVKKSKKNQDGECQMNNEELTKSEKKTKRKLKEMEEESGNKKSKIDLENLSDSNMKSSKKKNKEIQEENVDGKHVQKSDEKEHKKHKKSKKDKNQVANLSKARLEALGIKSGYYHHVLKKGNKEL